MLLMLFKYVTNFVKKVYVNAKSAMERESKRVILNVQRGTTNYV